MRARHMIVPYSLFKQWLELCLLFFGALGCLVMVLRGRERCRWIVENTKYRGILTEMLFKHRSNEPYEDNIESNYCVM